MKKALTICLTLILILTLFYGCAAVKPGGSTPEPVETETPGGETDTPVSETPAPTPSETGETTDVIKGLVAIETEEYEYTSEYIEVKLEIPQLTGLANSVVMDEVNTVFGDIMTAAQNGVMPAEEESKKLAEERGGTTIPYMTYISYGVTYNKDGFLCILISEYQYLGGAHGNDMWRSYTFDLNTGKRLSLEELMIADSGYRDLINTSIRTEIDTRTLTDVLLENAEFEDIGDDPDYYLTSDAIVFYFQEYAYFPYAAGIQEFHVTYDALSGMLKKEYADLTIMPVVLDNTSDNTLSVGDIGQVFMKGNSTTGYSWQYSINDTSILELSGENYQSDAAPGAVGAGGTYTWDFRALKTGTAEITFKYYREWLGESDAAPEDIVVFTVTVK